MVIMPAYADNVLNAKATINQNLSAKKAEGEIVQFSADEEIVIPDIIVIPQNSTIEAMIVRVQRELRWHKSGYALLKLLSYSEEGKEPVDILNKNIYLTARKYKYFDKQKAVMVGTEIAGSTAAAFFIPGIDIAYYFAKGAIVREDNPNWFKSGVSCAYNNSILWFTLKGKNIELEEGDKIQLKYFESDELEDRIEKIDKRKQKDLEKEAKNEQKAKNKEIKKELKEKREAEKESKMSEEELEEYLLKKEEKRIKQETKEIRKQFEYENWREKWDEKYEKREKVLQKRAELKKQEELSKEQKRAF